MLKKPLSSISLPIDRRSHALKEPVVGRSSSPYLLLPELLLKEIAAEAGGVTGRLLDVGCGQKPYRSLFSMQVEAYIGIDLPADASPCPPIDVVANASALPFEDETFDAILCTEVLEHVPSPQKVLEEARRVLRPNGKLILTCPQTYGLHEAPRDFYRFTRYGLAELLERQVEFEVEHIRPVGNSMDFAVDFFSKAAYEGLCRLPLARPGLVRRAVRSLQRAYLLVRSQRVDNEVFALGHIAVARKPMRSNSHEGVLPAMVARSR